MSEGVYLYEAIPHRLKPVVAGGFRSRSNRRAALTAPVNIFYVADISRYDMGPQQPDPNIGDAEVQKSYYYVAAGFDLRRGRVKASLENVEKNNVGHLVRIEQKDIFTLDLSKASVITLYLLPELNVKLIPQLEKLKPGSRIVSHDFDMKGVRPDKVITIEDKDDDYGDHTIYLWITPLKKEDVNDE